MSKILIASIAFDGHFNPLSSVAMHLKQRGHDVRWYTGPIYAERLAKMDIVHYPYVRARDVNANNFTEHFPEYAGMKLGPKMMELGAKEIFFGQIEAQLHDLREVHAKFPFDALICDGALYVSRIVAEKIQPRVYVVFPAPTPAPTSTSPRVPPPFFGLKPARTFIGRARDLIVHRVMDRTMRGGIELFNEVRAREGLPPYLDSGFNMHVEKCRAIFQIGVPGLDFPRTDWPANFQFIGALLPHRRPSVGLPPHLEEKLRRYRTMIPVSQGTTDNYDPDKLFVPALKALAGGEHLVVVTTGGKNTEALRRRFPQDNVVIEDWVDFHALLPHATLFICNGGFGSILLSFSSGVPVLSAGKLEGKADINARIDYHKVGIDLDTERPTPRQIRRGVARMLADPRFAERVARLRAELESYRPLEIIEQRLAADGITVDDRGGRPGATGSAARGQSPAQRPGSAAA